MSDEVTLKDFKQYYPYTPTALSIKECVRLRALRDVQCPSPVLDVGCGDGLFARLAFSGAEVWGIDIDGNEGRRAQASRAYSHVLLADVTRARLPEGFFGSCVANCSLEHIPDLDAALKTILRSLQPGASVFAFVPNREWAAHLFSARVLKKLGLETFSRSLQEAIDETFRHEHLHDGEGWRALFKRAGFEVDRVDPVGSTASTMAFEAFLLPSLGGLLVKKLTGRWTLAPALRKWGAVPVYALVSALLAANPEQAPTAEFLVAARRPAAS
jgi:SAM-dependent methyltransferase